MKPFNHLILLFILFGLVACSNVDPGSLTDYTATPSIPQGALPDSLKPDEEPETVDPNANIVEVSETFYKITYDRTLKTNIRTPVTEANFGDQLELVVSATNLSDVRLKDIELVNTVPNDSVSLIDGSVIVDISKGLYRVSRNGETFFPSDAEIPAASIRYIQWLIYALDPNETIELSYRLRVDAAN